MGTRQMNIRTVTGNFRIGLRCAACNKICILPHRNCKAAITEMVREARLAIDKKGEWNNSMWQELWDSFGNSIVNCSNDLKRKIASDIIDEYYISADHAQFNDDRNSLHKLLSGIENLTFDDREWQKFNSMEILTALKANRQHRVLFRQLQKSSSRHGDICLIWRQCSKAGFSMKAKFGLWATIWLGLLGSTALMGIIGIDFPEYLNNLTTLSRLLIELAASDDGKVAEEVVWKIGFLWALAIFTIFISVAIARFEFSFTRMALSPSGVLYFSRYRDCKIDWGEIYGVEALNVLGVKLIRVQIRNGSGFYQIVPKSDQRWFESVIKLCSKKAVRHNELAAVELLKTSLK